MNTKFIKDMLYQMKKDYGGEINYITVVQAVLDVETGKRDCIKQVHLMPVVVLPRKFQRKFIQDIGYLAANKNFTYGALNDYTEIKFLVDYDDMPRLLDVSLDGYLVFQNKRYEKTEFDIIEHGVAYMLTAKAAEGSKPYDVMSLKARNSLQLQHRVSYELN